MAAETDDLMAAVSPAAPRNEPDANAIERPMLAKAPVAAIVPRLMRPIACRSSWPSGSPS